MGGGAVAVVGVVRGFAVGVFLAADAFQPMAALIVFKLGEIAGVGELWREYFAAARTFLRSGIGRSVSVGGVTERCAFDSAAMLAGLWCGAIGGGVVVVTFLRAGHKEQNAGYKE